MVNNILPIHEMIDLLEDFFNNDRQHSIAIGGMEGSFIFKIVMEAALTTNKFERILVIEGCQDYTGFVKKQIGNFMYYIDLLVDTINDPLIPIDPFQPKIFNPPITYSRYINTNMISRYTAIVINNAHLIPIDIIRGIVGSTTSDVCIIGDPFDIGGEMFSDKPTITDSLNKLSPILSMARQVYNVDTRAIDRKISGNVTEAKISRRSIGKIDDKQYISDDPDLVDIVRYKQLQSPFRKHQKLLVKSNRIFTSLTGENTLAVSDNSMCVISTSSMNPLMRLRIYNSKNIICADATYSNNPPSHLIPVKPGNILSIEESRYHRYNTAQLVLSSTLTQREQYSILKNSNNVIISHV